MTLYQATCVGLQGRGILIEGPPGSGKSSLALALLDRGAQLIGDDGIHLSARTDGLYAAPVPATLGRLEIRNIGLVRREALPECRIALALRMDVEAPRFIEAADRLTLLGRSVPLVRLWPDSPVLALRAEAALERYGS